MDKRRLRAAEVALSRLWGAPVTCEVVDELRGRGHRSRVYRLRVTGGPVASVIFKSPAASAKHPYRVGDPTSGAAFDRLACEWAGLDMLAPGGLGPRVLGGDVRRGFCLIEDLGAGDALADVLLGDDAAAARAALFAYARSLGDMHAATLGATERWEELRRALGAEPATAGREDGWGKAAAAFTTYVEGLSAARPGGRSGAHRGCAERPALPCLHAQRLLPGQPHSAGRPRGVLRLRRGADAPCVDRRGLLLRPRFPPAGAARGCRTSCRAS